VKLEREYIEVDEEIVSVTTDLDGSYIILHIFVITKIGKISVLNTYIDILLEIFLTLIL